MERTRRLTESSVMRQCGGKSNISASSPREVRTTVNEKPTEINPTVNDLPLLTIGDALTRLGLIKTKKAQLAPEVTDMVRLSFYRVLGEAKWSINDAGEILYKFQETGLLVTDDRQEEMTSMATLKVYKVFGRQDCITTVVVDEIIGKLLEAGLCIVEYVPPVEEIPGQLIDVIFDGYGANVYSGTPSQCAIWLEDSQNSSATGAYVHLNGSEDLRDIFSGETYLQVWSRLIR